MGIIAKQYKLLSFVYFERNYHAEEISSVCVRRSKGFWRVFQLLSIFLNRKGKRQVQLLAFHPRKKDSLRAMAEQIASFLAIPVEAEV